MADHSIKLLFNNMKAIIIGGGIIGLSSAFYLQRSGWEVTVIDKGDFLDNCSYGNAGYISPSHFIPLATPGIVKKGLKWMWNSKSPFYVHPVHPWRCLVRCNFHGASETDLIAIHWCQCHPAFNKNGWIIYFIRGVFQCNRIATAGHQRNFYS